MDEFIAAVDKRDKKIEQIFMSSSILGRCAKSGRINYKMVQLYYNQQLEFEI